MFELNPLSQPDAWWQHSIMVVVACILGYVIGYRSRKSKVVELEGELLSLDNQLRKCQSNNHATLKERKVTKATRDVDNLKMIEGIGPKIEQVLRSSGINSYNELSQANVDHIISILKNAGARYQMHDPSTWPRQANLAANGEWERLKEWQDELDKGRE